MSSPPLPSLSVSVQSRASKIVVAADKNSTKERGCCWDFYQKYPTLDLIAHFCTLHSPFLAQVATLIISVIVLIISCAAILDNYNWNDELRAKNRTLYKSISRAYRSVYRNKTLLPEFVFRERREFLISVLLQGYVILAIILHMVNYWIVRNPYYRIVFRRIFNFGIFVIYVSSLLMILEGTVEFNTNYDEVKRLVIFRRCRIGGDVPSEGKKHLKVQNNTQVNVTHAQNVMPGQNATRAHNVTQQRNTTTPLITLTSNQNGLLCHRYDLRFAAIGLSILVLCVMSGILLFARTEAESTEKDEAIEDFLDDNKEDSRIHLVLVEKPTETTVASSKFLNTKTLFSFI